MSYIDSVLNIKLLNRSNSWTL